MLEELLKGVDEKELQVFTRKFGIKKMSNKEIADKNAIVTPKAGIAFSRSIASLHTAFNVIAATTKNRNNIEKARLDRLDTSTKEDYMEARLPLPPQLDAIRDTNADLINGIANALSDFSKLLDDLGDALSRLDLSCNVCIEPCEPVPENVRSRPPVPITQRERARERTRVGIPAEERVRIAAQRRATATAALPAPEGVARVKPAGALQYQPLPKAPDFTQRARQPEPVRVAQEAPRTIAQRFAAGELTREEARRLQVERVQAERVSAAKPTGGQARVIEPAPPRAQQPARQRWTSTVPKEQYFEAAEANRAQAEFERRARAAARASRPAARPSGPAAAPLALPAPTGYKAPGFFSRITTAAQKFGTGVSSTFSNISGAAQRFGAGITSKFTNIFGQGAVKQSAGAAGILSAGDLADRLIDIDAAQRSGRVTAKQADQMRSQARAGAAKSTAVGTGVGLAGSAFLNKAAIPAFNKYIAPKLGETALTRLGAIGTTAARALSIPVLAAYEAAKTTTYRSADWLIKSQVAQGESEVTQINKRLAPYGVKAIVSGVNAGGIYVNEYQIGSKRYKRNELPEYYKNAILAYGQSPSMDRWGNPERDAAREWLKKNKKPGAVPAAAPFSAGPAKQGSRVAKGPAVPSDRAIRKDAEKATRQLVTTTKKVQTQAQRVNAQDRRVAANTSSILDRFAGSLNNALRTMTMTAAAFPGLMGAGLTAGLTGTLSKFGRGFQQGIEGVTPATPNEAVNQAMAFFMSQDWTKEQAAGIVGNLQVESGNFDPDVVLGRRRGDRGNAIGIAQWNIQYSPERVANFQRVMGRPLLGAGLQEQLQFVQWELNNTEKRAAAALRQTNDPGQAAAIIDAMYERSSGAHRAQRMANAMALASGGDTMVTQAGRFAGNIFGGVTNFLGDVGNLFTGTPGQLAFPVGRARVSSGYGMRTHPEYGTVKMHSGIDFAVPVGTPVVASESGKVTLAGSSRGYGWNIVVAHGGGLGTRYAHLARFLVGPGQTVQKGQVIALSGGARGMPGAGTSTGPHLHYEVLKNGQAINPASFLSGASLAAVSPERGNNATEEDAVRPTSKQPARGGYLADIVTGNAAARRRKQGPKVVVVQAPSRIQPPASLAARGAQRPGTGRGPTIDYSRLYFNK